MDNGAFSGLASTCKACRSIYAKSTHSKIVQKKGYAKWAKNKKTHITESARVRLLKRKFNLTHREYEQLYQNQNGLCAVCGESEMVDGRHLAVDHDHETEKIRGLLCGRCNLMLGRIENNMEITLKMLKYIKVGGL